MWLIQASTSLSLVKSGVGKEVIAQNLLPTVTSRR